MSRTLVKDLMTAEVRTVSRSTPLGVVRQLMEDGRFRHVPVVDDDELVGLLTDRDLQRVYGRSPRRVHDELSEVAAERVMTFPVETADPDEPLRDAGERMLEAKYGCLPVVEGRLLVGMLTESDFVRLYVTADDEG
jgi:CBS domain-containing membrane protein